MQYTLTITQEKIEYLRSFLLKNEKEGAAYLLCKKSSTGKENRLLVKEILLVEDEHYLLREAAKLTLDSFSYAAAVKRAARDGFHIIFLHSHVAEFAAFSEQDNKEEPKLMAFFQTRLPKKIIGSAVLTKHCFTGRVWLNGLWRELDKTRIIGEKIKITSKNVTMSAVDEIFDRQIRAFGLEGQRQLKALHIGIVGAGGTGSAVAEQLARLGVGEISIWDGDTLEASNINRVYGSRLTDARKNKAKILGNHLRRIGLGGNKININPRFITVMAAAKKLRECDIIFCCTDDHASRGILMRLGIYYLIPIIDTAVIITSDRSTITGVFGRITILTPEGGSCLFCRERIDPKIIAAETMKKEARDRLVKEGYAPELDIKNPSVITFTTAVAAHAIGALLDKLYNFKVGIKSTETLLLFHQDVIRKPSSQPRRCLCQIADSWGKGDNKKGFLDLSW